jgi:hypothetical protein
MNPAAANITCLKIDIYKIYNDVSTSHDLPIPQMSSRASSHLFKQFLLHKD